MLLKNIVPLISENILTSGIYRVNKSPGSAVGVVFALLKIQISQLLIQVAHSVKLVKMQANFMNRQVEVPVLIHVSFNAVASNLFV